MGGSIEDASNSQVVDNDTSLSSEHKEERDVRRTIKPLRKV